MSSGDDGWEEATGIFKAVMSSEAPNVGGAQERRLLSGEEKEFRELFKRLKTAFSL